MFSTLLRCSLLCAFLLCHTLAYAGNTAKGLSISQTRVIFNETESSAAISMINKGEKAWLVRGRVTTSPGEGSQAPFVITPPLFRLEPDSRSAIRIVRLGGTLLPQDKESVFYLSLLSIPASSVQNANNNSGVDAKVTVGIDSVIKLFYRPAELQHKPTNIGDSLQFISDKNKLSVINKSAYYITLASLKLDDEIIHVRQNMTMIAPFSEIKFPVKKRGRMVSWSVVTDYGGSSNVYKKIAN